MPAQPANRGTATSPEGGRGLTRTLTVGVRQDGSNTVFSLETVSLRPPGPMTPRPVHWHEGMFLRPHHFQAADRHAARLLAQNVGLVRSHGWGLGRCLIDPEALGGFRLVVRGLEARFRDGTTISLPGRCARCPTSISSPPSPTARASTSTSRSRSGGRASRTCITSTATVTGPLSRRAAAGGRREHRRESAAGAVPHAERPRSARR